MKPHLKNQSNPFKHCIQRKRCKGEVRQTQMKTDVSFISYSYNRIVL